MAIEDTLSSIDTSLKMIVTILQSAGAISATPTLSAPAAADTATTEKKTRAKKTETTPAASLVEGDAEGTRYWVSEELSTVYTQKPGDPDPQPASFKLESAEHYTAKKAEFAAKKPAAVAPTTAPAATPAATTPAASTASSEVQWKEVLGAIQALNKGTAPGQGRDGVMAVLKQFGLEGQKVPALEALGMHADILAFVQGLMTPADESDDLGI